jgi:hypothetical protein
MSWDVQNEKLLSYVVLNDRYSRMLSSRAGDAFFRAFIVQNRATGQILMKLRFKYRDGERSWFEVTPTGRGEAAVEELRKGVRQVLETSAAIQGTPLPAGAIEFFDPPDDGGIPERTLDWLLAHDLIEVSVEEIPHGPR